MLLARFAPVALRRRVASTAVDYAARLRQHQDDMQVLTSWPNAFDDMLNIAHELAEEERARRTTARLLTLPRRSGPPQRVVALGPHRVARLRGHSIG